MRLQERRGASLGKGTMRQEWGSQNYGACAWEGGGASERGMQRTGRCRETSQPEGALHLQSLERILKVPLKAEAVLPLTTKRIEIKLFY